ncbi:ornithine cyclodeaminase family protein [Pseudomonas syringae]|nr:hypothetical protein [Pseudomonas syringae]KPZ30568.1 hypothetical protein AN901_202643 [Pseudomonas syringae pv. theae]GKQ30539.1 ornithine cyclodeaminase family protein [Pseudomonas syringae pv. theae]
MKNEQPPQFAFISHQSIKSSAKLNQLIQFIGQELQTGGRNSAIVPGRSMTYSDAGASAYFTMPALSERLGLYLSKVATFKQRDKADARPTINSIVVTYNSHSGLPAAFIDGAALTDLKCAALSAWITDLCAKPNVTKMALLGSGVQAIQQILGVTAVRKIKRLAIWSRQEKNAQALIEKCCGLIDPSIEIELANSVEDAITDAQVILTATSSLVPLGLFEHLEPGVDINCMGAHTPYSRELPLTLLEKSTLIVEDRKTAIDEAGEVHMHALQPEELLNEDDLFNKRTIFSSTGYAFYDLLTAAYIIRQTT